MEDEDDLYAILGLKPGLDGGAGASAEAIRKSYRAKALLCHPDKRPDDPLAAAEFQRLQKAYDILSDEKARKAYDDLLNVRKARLEKENKVDLKRRKMMEDLRNRENLFKACSKEKEDEERAVKQFQKEIARIRATRGQRAAPFEAFKSEKKTEKQDDAQDQERMLKVSWKPVKNGGSDYSASMLKDIFRQFDSVEDVVILQNTGAGKQSSALVVMGSRNGVLAAMRQSHHPLVVEPLVPYSSSSSAFAEGPTTSTTNGDSTPAINLGKLVGNAFHDYEDSILKKMQKKAEKLKSNTS